MKEFHPMIFSDWLPLVKTMTEHERSELLLALLSGEEPTDVPLWPFFKQQLEKQRKHLLEKSEKAKQSAKKRWDECERTQNDANACNGMRTHANDANGCLTEPYRTEPNQKKEVKEKNSSRKSDDFRATVFPKIVSKYNSILGDKLPRVSAQSDKRIEKCRKWANALYREKGCKSQDELLGEAEKFFRQVLRCPFLLGESGGDRHWRADFDFLMTEKGRIGVVEGKYLSTGKEASSFYKPVHDWEAEQQAYYEKQREQEMSHAEAVNAYLQGGKA